MTTTIAEATERQKNAQRTIERYRNHLYEMLPSHLAGLEKTWMRVAFGAIRKNPKLIDACNEDPDAVINSLMEAARLGLEPGSDEYYLTPRRRKVNGRYIASVLGIVGYQGEIELIYRAGAVSSVVCDLVYERDTFVWRPGALDREVPARWEGPQRQPYHEADWFGDRGDTTGARHGVRGAYAYGVMKDGAISKVVIVDQRRIDRAMAAAQDAQGEHSPWQTDYPAMVLKTGAHDLAKWVPTSSEYRLRPTVASERVNAEPSAVSSGNAAQLPGAPTSAIEAGEPVEFDENGVVSAEIVDDPETPVRPAEPPVETSPEQSVPTEPGNASGLTDADWDAAIAESVAAGDLEGLYGTYQSALAAEPENTELHERIKAAKPRVLAVIGERSDEQDPNASSPDDHDPEQLAANRTRDELRKWMFARLAEGGVSDTKVSRETRLLILNRLLTKVPAATTSDDLTDLELAKVIVALEGYRREGRLTEQMEQMSQVSTS